MAGKERISIVGTGLIGTSIGLALKKANLAGVEVVGHDRDSGNAGRARKMGALDRTEWNLISAIDSANLVIIATPILAIKDTLAAIAPHLAEGCVVTDTASTKAQVMAWAQELLPPSVSFVGGHPMAGKETPGPEAAEAGLFEGTVYCLMPAPTARQAAVEMVVGLVNVLGAKPFFVDAAEHDGFVAGVSHLPFLLSAAFVSATTRGSSWREMARLASSGYRDVSRLASGDPIMHRDICDTNRDGIVRWIDSYIDELKAYRRLVVEGGDALHAELARAQTARDKWLARRGEDVDATPAPEIPGTAETMGSLLMGRRLLDATKRLEKKEKSR